MSDNIKAGGLWEKMLLVLIGAICGVIPILVAQQLQSHTQKEQQILERKLSIMREYGSACGRMIAVSNQIILYQGISELGGSRLIEFKNVWKTLEDANTAMNDLYIASVLSEAFFGNDVESCLSSCSGELIKGIRLAQDVKTGVPSAIKAKQELFEKMPHILTTFAEKCEKNMEFMQDQITKTIKK